MNTTATTAHTADHLTPGDPQAYRHGCRCPECQTGNWKHRKQQATRRRAGQGATRSPGRAAAHIRALELAGLTRTQILQSAHLSPFTMSCIKRGTTNIRLATEIRILAVPIPAAGAPSLAYTPGTGTRRRLRALALNGWSTGALEKRTGIPRRWLWDISVGDGGQVTLRTEQAVRAAHADLWDKQAEDHGTPAHLARQVRDAALRRGWHPTAVWDDLDDLDGEAQYGPESSRKDAVIEDSAELVRQGYNQEAIAGRLGITWDAVRQAHRRAGVQVPSVLE